MQSEHTVMQNSQNGNVDVSNPPNMRCQLSNALQLLRWSTALDGAYV